MEQLAWGKSVQVIVLALTGYWRPVLQLKRASRWSCVYAVAYVEISLLVS